MLQHEDDIKHDRDVGQSEFDRIARHARPVVLQGRINGQLGQRKPPSGKIHEHRIDAPPHGRLALVVYPHLWNVLADHSN